jgi:hypothetical protein
MVGVAIATPVEPVTVGLDFPPEVGHLP